MQVFSLEKIKEHLTSEAEAFIQSILLFPNVTSTNDYLLKLNRHDQQNGVVCLAESQSQGRGRMGKQWKSPPAGNIYFSLAWEPISALPHLHALSLVVALATLFACKSVGVTEEIKIKWPNDVVLNQKKCAGILIETVGLPEDRARIVIGIGVNLNRHTSMQANWASLNHEHLTINPNCLVSELINELVDCLALFEQHGFEPFQTRWHQYDALWQQSISTANLQGIAQGVNAKGELQLLTQEGTIMQLNSGEISIGS